MQPVLAGEDLCRQPCCPLPVLGVQGALGDGDEGMDAVTGVCDLAGYFFGLLELFDDPQFDQWTPLTSPFDLSAARAYLAKARQEHSAGRCIQLAITTDGRNALGEVLLVRRIENGPQTAELA